jgi:hypothetical protein
MWECEKLTRTAARINSILLNTVWLSVPLFVSVFSFLSYVLLGHELTVAAAFTVRMEPRDSKLFADSHIFS